MTLRGFTQAWVFLVGVGLCADSNAASACGMVIASYRGVPAYSNGERHGTFDNCHDVRGRDGWEFQCVEYVRRFYRVALGIDTRKENGWDGNAADYFLESSARRKGLTRFLNGQSTDAPNPDDIVVFTGDRDGLGHVAIVTSASASTLTVIEQNWSASGTAELGISRDIQSGRWTITPRGRYTVAGWLRRSQAVDFFEGWEASAPGSPICEPPMEVGFINCAISGDSGQWLVTEWREAGVSISSVEILPGQMLKLQPTQNGEPGHVTSRSVRSALSPTSTISFTNHSAYLGNSVYPSYVEMRIYLTAPNGTFLPCPGTGLNVGDTFISYILETNPSAAPAVSQCTASVRIGPTSSVSRNIFNDFVNLLPFSPDGWTITQITLSVIPGDAEATNIWATWDNILLTP